MLPLLSRLVRHPAKGERRTTYRDRYAIASVLSLLPLPLARILALFGSDKQRPGEHSYGAAYAAVFGPFRYRRTKLLEIGLLSGDSLLAWRCYFPRGTTIGADIEPKQHLAGARTRIYTTDQSSADDLATLAAKEGPFDIIIDDGSHQNAHQIFTFHALFDSLRDGGVYVIEDVQTSF
ncbi:MAG: class I SAM-dependent methyltransferase, partial [Rhodospirillales bacterium]|nr:class I SAM-dependent methyltransferase [Rhodospirillales bacterium]